MSLFILHRVRRVARNWSADAAGSAGRSHADGRVAELCTAQPDDAVLVDELHLTAYARFPDDTEHRAVIEFLKENRDRRREAVEDVLWSLVNTTEFLFNH